MFKSAKKLKFEVQDTGLTNDFQLEEHSTYSEVVPFKLNTNSFMGSNAFDPVDEEMTEDDNECRTPSMMMTNNNHIF